MQNTDNDSDSKSDDDSQDEIKGKKVDVAAMTSTDSSRDCRLL